MAHGQMLLLVIISTTYTYCIHILVFISSQGQEAIQTESLVQGPFHIYDCTEGMPPQKPTIHGTPKWVLRADSPLRGRFGQSGASQLPSIGFHVLTRPFFLIFRFGGCNKKHHLFFGEPIPRAACGKAQPAKKIPGALLAGWFDRRDELLVRVRCCRCWTRTARCWTPPCPPTPGWAATSWRLGL